VEEGEEKEDRTKVDERLLDCPSKELREGFHQEKRDISSIQRLIFDLQSDLGLNFDSSRLDLPFFRHEC